MPNKYLNIYFNQTFFTQNKQKQVGHNSNLSKKKNKYFVVQFDIDYSLK